jgi:hypothetical protein
MYLTPRSESTQNNRRQKPRSINQESLKMNSETAAPPSTVHDVILAFFAPECLQFVSQLAHPPRGDVEADESTNNASQISSHQPKHEKLPRRCDM